MTSYYLTDRGREHLEFLRDIIPNQARGGRRSQKEDTDLIVYTILNAIDRGDNYEDMLTPIINARAMVAPGPEYLSTSTIQRAEENLRRLLSILLEQNFIEKYDTLPEAFSDFRMYE